MSYWSLSGWAIALALTFIILRVHPRSPPDFSLASAPPAKLEILAALLLIAVGLIVRFSFLGEFFGGRLSGDEYLAPFVYTSKVVHGEAAQNGATHLTLALAFDLWYKTFNLSPLAARALSATLGTISLIFFFLGLRRAAGTRLAMWSAAFLSISLYGVYFSKLALEIGWTLFIPPIVLYLLVLASQKRSALLAASAGLVFSLGLFTYPGFLLATISVIAGMAISFIIYRRKAAPSWWRSSYWWIMALAFVAGSIPYTIFAIYQHLTILGVGQPLLRGGGAVSFTIAAALSGWKIVLYDALFGSNSWYLIHGDMAFLETALLPLAIYGVFIFWRTVTHADREKRWMWYGLFLSIPILIAMVPFTGPYPGMRRALFVLLPYSVAVGGGLIFLFSAITAHRAMLAIPDFKRNRPLYKMLGLGILMLAVAHPIAYQFTSGRDRSRINLGEGFSRKQIPTSFILKKLKSHDIILEQAEFNSGWFDASIYEQYPRLYNRYNTDADIPHQVLILTHGELTKLSDKILMTWNSRKFDKLLAAGKITITPENKPSNGTSIPYWGVLTTAPFEYAADNTAFNLTDPNWINGIAVRWAGFFVDNNSANLAEFTPGKKIGFSDGSERIIIKQTQNGPYLNIDLSGPPLDGTKVGYPNIFRINNE